MLAFCYEYSATIIDYLPEIGFSFLPNFLASVLDGIVSFFSGLIATLISIFAATFLSFLVVLGLGSFFIELFIEKVLESRGMKSKLEIAFLPSLIRGLKDDFSKTIILLVISILLLIAGFIPILVPFVFLFGAFIVGFEILELPLLLLNQPLGQRIKASIKIWPKTLMIGLIFSIIAFVPFLALLLMPIGYVIAIDQIKEDKLYSLPSSSSS